MKERYFHYLSVAGLFVLTVLLTAALSTTQS